MPKDGDVEQNLRAHPVLKKLAGAREGPVDAMALLGYVGPSSSDDYVSVFPSLVDLSESFEIARADILAVEDAPASVLADGGKIFWVKQETEVIHSRSRTVRTHVRNLREVREGRLLIRMPRRAASADGPDGGTDCKACVCVCCLYS